MQLEKMDAERIRTTARQAIEDSQDNGFKRFVSKWEQAMCSGKTDNEQGIAHFLLIDDFMLIAMNYEVFTALGRRIITALPRRLVLIAGNSDRCLGYLPTRSLQDKGGYESKDSIFLYCRCPIAIGGAEAYIDRIIERLKRSPFLLNEK